MERRGAGRKRGTREATFVDLICFKFFNLGDLGVDIKHKNGHNSGPRRSSITRIWHAPSYHTAKGFFMPKGIQF